MTTGSQSTFPNVSYQVNQQRVIHKLFYDALKQELHITLFIKDRKGRVGGGGYSLSTEFGCLFTVYVCGCLAQETFLYITNAHQCNKKEEL